MIRSFLKGCIVCGWGGGRVTSTLGHILGPGDALSFSAGTRLTGQLTNGVLVRPWRTLDALLLLTTVEGPHTTAHWGRRCSWVFVGPPAGVCCYDMTGYWNFTAFPFSENLSRAAGLGSLWDPGRLLGHFILGPRELDVELLLVDGLPEGPHGVLQLLLHLLPHTGHVARVCSRDQSDLSLMGKYLEFTSEITFGILNCWIIYIVSCLNGVYSIYSGLKSFLNSCLLWKTSMRVPLSMFMCRLTLFTMSVCYLNPSRQTKSESHLRPPPPSSPSQTLQWCGKPLWREICVLVYASLMSRTWGWRMSPGSRLCMETGHLT